MRKTILPVTLAGFWIVISEFIRNEFFFKHYWVSHFKVLNLGFETRPVNGVLWMVWSFTFAWVIARLLQRFSFKETFILAWLVGFAMMWPVLYNLQVLPRTLLFFAIPLSLLEVVVAELIITKIGR